MHSSYLPSRWVKSVASFVALLVLAVVTGNCGGAKAADLPDYTPDSNAARESIPAVYTWDLTQLFKDAAAWDAKRVALSDELAKLEAYKGKLADPKALKEALALYFDLHNQTNQITLYANMLTDSYSSNADFAAMAQKGLALLDETMAQATFIRGEIMALDDAAMSAAYGAEPGLETYRNYIDGLRRRRARVLNEDAERVMGLFGDNLWAEIDLNEIPSPAEDVFNAVRGEIEFPMIKDGDGKDVQLNFSNYGLFRSDPKREVRAAAVEAFLATLRKSENSLAAALAAQAKFDVELARSRTYSTALDAYLDKDNIDTAVYMNLIAAVNANLEPLHRYVQLRKKVLGVDEVHMYDLYVPLVASAEKKIPFKDARDIIIAALAPMGEEYVKVLTEGLDPANGWLDLYPSNDKNSGAFSASVYGLHPYVKMNYQDTMDDMSTLAHEFGHALHSYLSSKHQSYSEYRYVPFLAEIPSTANQALLTDYLLANADDPAIKASVLVERLEDIRSTIYRQTLFAEFELALHTFVEEGTPVTAELLNKTYGDLVAKYYGPDYTMGENDGIEWAYVPHFYWKYYVFNYATGLSSGIAIAKLVRQGQAQRDAYLGMLSAGCSKPPLEILKGAGVDLSKPDAINLALQQFDETLTELEALLPQLEKQAQN